MNEQKTLLYRLNLGYENAEAFRDLQPNKTFVIAPSFSFLPNEKTSMNSQPAPNVPFVNQANPQPTIASPENYIYTSQSYAPTQYYTYGVYVQDQVKYGPLQVLLGLSN